MTGNNYSRDPLDLARQELDFAALASSAPAVKDIMYKAQTMAPLPSSQRLDKAAAPILEINPRHERIAALARLGKKDRAFKEDAAHLLYDEARVLDGDKPADARAFAERLSRLIGRALPG